MELNLRRVVSGAIDAVLIRNAYHEMPEYKAVLAGVSRALRPGGILVVIQGRLLAHSRPSPVTRHL